MMRFKTFVFREWLTANLTRATPLFLAFAKPMEQHRCTIEICLKSFFSRTGEIGLKVTISKWILRPVDFVFTLHIQQIANSEFVASLDTIRCWEFMIACAVNSFPAGGFHPVDWTNSSWTNVNDAVFPNPPIIK